MATIIRPDSTDNTGSWIASDTDHESDTSDQSDLTYISAATEDEVKIILAAATPGPSTNVLSIQCADASDGEGSGELTVKLYQGVTLKQTFTIGPDLGGTPTTHDLSVSVSITDYSDLRVWLGASGTWGDVTNLRVHEIYLTITDAVTSSALSSAGFHLARRRKKIAYINRRRDSDKTRSSE